MKMFMALALLVGANLVVAAPRQPVTLKTAPAGRVGTELIRSVCPQLPVPCDPANVTAWVGTRDGTGPLYLIDAGRPMLVALDAAEPARTDLARQWDFREYVHSTPPVADGGSPEPLRIDPELYPVGITDWAVAIVSMSRENYSGGWASFHVADFVSLDAPAKALYKAVPFLCSKVIRACFSEREYRRSRHCHEENGGHLTIRFGEGEAGWRFMWHETHWPGNTPRRRQTSTHVPFLPDNMDAAFCGGPS